MVNAALIAEPNFSCLTPFAVPRAVAAARV